MTSVVTKASQGNTPDEQPRRGASRYSPRTKRIIRQAYVTSQTLPGTIFPQWLRTALVTLLWLGSVPVYVQLISPYVTMRSAVSMAVGLAMFAGIAPHLWPTRTPPWRTVLWALFLSAVTGMTMLTLGAGRLSLTGATLVGFAIVLLRINQNGRKLWGLVQTWRHVR